jgi:hypothetical protein
MAVNRIRRNGSYAPLSSAYYKDDSLAAVGPMAELLFCRGLAFCAEVLSDGFISDTQLSRFVGAGIPNVAKHAEQLATVGGCDKSPWIRDGSGYRVRQWLKWNYSRDEIKAKQDTDNARKPKVGKGADSDSTD